MIFSRDLKTVAVDQLDGRVLRNDDISVIHIADNVTVFLDYGKGSRKIRRGVDEERPAGVWEIGKAAFGAVKNVNAFVISDPLHHETYNSSSRLFVQCVYRQGR